MSERAPLENAEHTPRLILVDGSGYIFRAYHALPPLTRRDGVAVGAVYGFTTMLMRLRETYKHDLLAVIFDASRKSFRNEIYENYKAHRPPAPDDLIPQFALVREATRALSIPAIELDQYEADDLIASYACAARAVAREVVIVSSDKDFMQLVVDGAITMIDPIKQKFIGSAQVVEKFGVLPEKVLEVQALIGDAVDNIPGVPSIGPKTAAELIGQYGTVENLLAHLDEIKQPKRREVLTLHAENARLSRRLVELKCDVPLPMPLHELATRAVDQAVLAEFLNAQNFSTLAKKLGLASDATTASKSTKLSHFASSPNAQPAPAIITGPAIEAHYETVTDEAALARWVEESMRGGVVAIDTETTSLNGTDAELVGISLATRAGHACYIPVGHVSEMAAPRVAQGGLFDAPAATEKKLFPGQLPLTRVLEILKPLLIHPNVLKVGHNLKYDTLVLTKYDVQIAPLADTMLMSYCLGGGLHAHGMDYLAEAKLGHKMIPYTDVVGTGKAQKNFAEVELASATQYAAEDADFTLRLYELLAPKLVQDKVVGVYETIERPLVPVIASMEAAGIAIDTTALNGLSVQFSVQLAELEKEIVALAGMPFSVGSPKQLGEVLYDKLQLGGAKKSSKTGAYTTDAATLELLAEQGHEIAKKVLEWRQYSKLKSTYTDALPRAISPRDGRVHTCYSMAATTTGRLSSTEPNLQNIPIRTEEGKRIRTAFIASPGHSLISADYSQIELRLLAHMADIRVLREAFRNGTDIHAVTASQMFGVPLADVSGELRRRAKMINFGIIYGISAHGLASRLGIGRAEAGDYIAKYFAQYPGIREYMDRTIEFARAHGYVETLYGRRVHVKDINSKNGAFRQFSERAAINAPLQGTAADIIKRAMVAVHSKLEGRAKLLLQVHDELVAEAPTDLAPTIAADMKRAMEQVAALSIPLTVDVGIGAHWGAAH